jgi:hypothetical protein
MGALAFAVVHVFWNGRPGGDPGNKVLRSLQQIEGAVPPTASHVRVQSFAAQWLPACPEFHNANAGWSRVQVNVQFVDGDSRSTLADQMDSVLRRKGWVRMDVAPGPHEGRIAHWTHKEPTGSKGTVFAFPAPADSHSWVLTAEWQPPGPANQGCP